MFEKIDKLQALIDEKRPFDEGLMNLLQERLHIEWTYNSNAIEGNTLAFGETAFFLREGLTSEGRPLKDYIEAKNHAEAIDWLNDIIKDKRKLSEGVIKELYALLMKGVEFTLAKGQGGKLIKKSMNVGTYKIRPNHVLTISGKIHKYADPLQVNSEMEKLLKWFQKNKSLHPVEKAATFHYKFIAIHPFDDGNGRMSRLLMNLILMKAGYPSCIIKNENRRKYLKALEKADTEGDLQPFIDFIASEMNSTLEVVEGIIQGKNSALPAELIGKLNQKQREEKVLEVIGNKPLSIGQIHLELHNIKRPTLKSDLKRMLKTGKIHSRGVGKGVIYSRNKL